jgi:HEAT repeat protein/lysophospholipase L1-like esterase
MVIEGADPPSRLRGLAANLALSLGTIVVLLATLEGVCRLVEDAPPPRPVASYIAVWNDGEFYTVKSAATGWPPWEDYNRDGMRDREHALAKSDGVRRLVLLGDSVTLGYGLRPEQAFPQVLQDVLDGRGQEVEVFNVALGGWSTRQERIAYERIARKYHPDEVVVSVCLNDIPEIHNNLARPPRLLRELHARSALVRRLVGARRREIHDVEELFETPESASVKDAIHDFSDELRQLRAEVEADGAAFEVALLPFRLQVEPRAPAATVQQRIGALCRDQRIPFLDILPGLRGLGPAAFLDYDHLSAAGARRVAEILADSVLTVDDAHGRPAPVTGSLPPTATTSLAQWIERLRDADPGARAAAARALGNATGDPRSAVPPLTRSLADPEPSVRAAAAWALGGFGGDAATAIPTLTAILDDPSPQARAGAAHALGAIGPAARAVAAHLVPHLADPADEVRWRAEDALGRIGPDVETCLPPLLELLSDSSGPGRAGAAFVIGRMGAGARSAVPVLVAALADSRAEVRWKAAWALGEMGPDAHAAVPALVSLARDPDIGWHAIDALGGLGAGAAPAVPWLRSALSDSSGNVRWRAALALGRIGPPASLAAPELRIALTDSADSVRLAAVHALGHVEAESAADVSALAMALRTDEDSRVRAAAALTLGRLHGADRTMREALLAGAGDTDPLVRAAALHALRRIPPSDAVDTALARARDDPDPEVRAEALRAGKSRRR